MVPPTDAHHLLGKLVHLRQPREISQLTSVSLDDGGTEVVGHSHNVACLWFEAKTRLSTLEAFPREMNSYFMLAQIRLNTTSPLQKALGFSFLKFT